MVIAMFTNACVKTIVTTPTHNTRPILSPATMAVYNPQIIRIPYSDTTASDPTNPSSSEITEKMKSVGATVRGRNPKMFCVPLK